MRGRYVPRDALAKTSRGEGGPGTGADAYLTAARRWGAVAQVRALGLVKSREGLTRAAALAAHPAVAGARRESPYRVRR